MDINEVASQLVGYLGNDQDHINQFVNHPYSTTAKVAGTDEEISKKDMSQILTQVAALTNQQSLGGTDTANIASMLLGQSGNSIHSLASALFGGGNAAPAAANASAGPSTAQIAAQSIIGGIAARGLAQLITGALGANQNNQGSQNNATAQVPSALPNMGNLDFGALAQIASSFLGK